MLHENGFEKLVPHGVPKRLYEKRRMAINRRPYSQRYLDNDVTFRLALRFKVTFNGRSLNHRATCLLISWRWHHSNYFSSSFFSSFLSLSGVLFHVVWTIPAVTVAVRHPTAASSTSAIWALHLGQLWQLWGQMVQFIITIRATVSNADLESRLCAFRRMGYVTRSC